MAPSFVKYFSEKEVKKYSSTPCFFSQGHAKLHRAQKVKSDQRNFDFFRKFGSKNRHYRLKNGPFRLEK
jgi:hypothetical protein